MGKYLIIIVSMVLVNNYPLAQFLGICPFLGVSKDKDSATGMGIAVTFVMVLATAVTWPIQQLLNKFGIGYMQTVVFILVIAALVQLIEMFMKKNMVGLYKSLGVYLPPKLCSTRSAQVSVSCSPCSLWQACAADLKTRAVFPSPSEVFRSFCSQQRSCP